MTQGQISQHAAEALPVWPTQFIEAAGCALLFGILWWLYRTQRARLGLCTGVYSMGYACLRYGVECLRDDPRGATYCGLSFSQMISLGLLTFGALMILSAFLWRKNDGTENR